MAPSALILLAMTIYTGYAIPIPYMRGWARWINYLDPIAYGFESVVVNELSGRLFQCNQLVPSGPGYNGLQNQACSSVGSTAGSDFVLGDSYVEASYQYLHSHKWRNVGILIGFMVFFLLWHLLTTGESSSQTKQLSIYRIHHRQALQGRIIGVPTEAYAVQSTKRG